jgi:hypothetical protein
VGFEQATIKIEHEQEFAELQEIIDGVLSPEQVEQFLKRLKKDSLRVRDWNSILASGVLEKMHRGTVAKSLYDSLTLSDQAQMREFYLSRIEQVDAALRYRFKRLYQYY